MIRFSAALVAVAIGVLVGGMAASSLLLVYVAIGLSVVALLMLAFGVALKREEIFGEQGQSALAGQGANASFGQERPGSQGVFGKPFGKQAAVFGQAAWAAPPVPRTGAGAPWSPSAASAPAAAATPGPEIPPWRKRFTSSAPQQPAASAPQQPAAQTRADAAQTRADLAKTRTDLTETKADLTETKADLTETADTAPGRSAALSWFERIAPARPVDDDIKAEDADAAGSPAGESHAESESVAEDDAHAEDAEDTTVEDEAVGTDATADAVAGDTDAAAAEDTDAAADAAAEDTEAAAAEDTEAENTDDAEAATEPSAAGPDAEAEAEDGTQAEAADSSPDGDQEGRSGQREVTVVPGVSRYHDTSCILIRFMGDDDLQKMTLDEATEAGCTPCRACMPQHA